MGIWGGSSKTPDSMQLYHKIIIKHKNKKGKIKKKKELGSNALDKANIPYMLTHHPKTTGIVTGGQKKFLKQYYIFFFLEKSHSHTII